MTNILKCFRIMSLDLYIRSHHPVKHRGTGIFIRDNGQTRELKTIEEVKAHFPDADISGINIREWEDDELFHCNMTHNLTEMASHVPIDGTDGVMTLPRDFERGKPDWKPEPLSAYNLLKCSGDFVKVLLDIPSEEYDQYYLYCWT